jgi:hypothetical protein
MRCPYCKKEYPDEERFCEICGTPLVERKPEQLEQKISQPTERSHPLVRCPHCGEMHPANMFFCPNMPDKLIEAQDEPPPTTQVRRAKLVLTGNDEIELVKAMTTLGRHDFARVAPAENLPYISREHFRIILDNGTYFIEDDRSKNGTWLNGELITGKGRQRLKDGDIIDVGNVTTATFKVE